MRHPIDEKKRKEKKGRTTSSIIFEFSGVAD
jgi:hypothetical protein